MSTATNAIAEARRLRLEASRTAPPTHRLANLLREPHPFARNPTTLLPHPSPWLSVYGARTLRTFGVLVPLAVVVFGWPFAGKWLVNASNGVYAPKEEVGKSHKIVRRAMLQQGPERLEA